MSIRIMQTFNRFEFKYLITPAIAAALRQRFLRFGMQADPVMKHFPGESYPVTSLYFDTPLMDDYHDKAGGFLRRKKIRVRIYKPQLFVPGETEIWLEKKEKYEMLTSKRRIRLSSLEYENLIHGLRVAIVRRAPAFLPLLTDGMRPVVTVRYMRQPFVSPHQSDLRITFDSRIEANTGTDLCVPLPMTRLRPDRNWGFGGQAADFVIMEVKFRFMLPFWFHYILQEFQLSRIAFSKYGRSVEAVRRFNPIPR